MKNELAEAKAALSRIAAGTNHAGDIRAVRVVIERLEALFTPRADDVREALVSELRLWAALIGTEPRGARDLLTRAADALAEVRPRGTVTDAEVEAAYAAYKASPLFLGAERLDSAERRTIRAVLEAAREVPRGD